MREYKRSNLASATLHPGKNSADKVLSAVRTIAAMALDDGMTLHCSRQCIESRHRANVVPVNLMFINSSARRPRRSRRGGSAGSSKELALHAGTINAVCEQYAKSRRQRNRPFLRWRGRRSLGWVPLKGRDLKREIDSRAFLREPAVRCEVP
jgi:hypothetical protein